MDNYDEILKKVSDALAKQGASPILKPADTDEATLDADFPHEQAESKKTADISVLTEETEVAASAEKVSFVPVSTYEQADEEDDDEEEISLTGWLWRLCIPVIPCVGIFAYLIMLCIWTFGNKPEPSYFRTWAKAALIATVIQIAFFLVILLAVQLSGMDIIGLVATFLKKAL